MYLESLGENVAFYLTVEGSTPPPSADVILTEDSQSLLTESAQDILIES
jgi:hypothetical protein